MQRKSPPVGKGMNILLNLLPAVPLVVEHFHLFPCYGWFLCTALNTRSFIKIFYYYYHRNNKLLFFLRVFVTIFVLLTFCFYHKRIIGNIFYAWCCSVLDFLEFNVGKKSETWNISTHKGYPLLLGIIKCRDYFSLHPNKMKA